MSKLADGGTEGGGGGGETDRGEFHTVPDQSHLFSIIFMSGGLMKKFQSLMSPAQKRKDLLPRDLNLKNVEEEEEI